MAKFKNVFINVFYFLQKHNCLYISQYLIINNLMSFNNQNKQVQQATEILAKRRDEFTQHIRKENRNEIITKRRNRNLDIQKKSNEFLIKAAQQTVQDEKLRKIIQSYTQRQYSIDQFMYLVACINSNDDEKIHYGIIGVRKLLSVQDNPPIQLVIDANLISKMIQFMKQTKFPHLQLQATWALTNIASGTSLQCQSIIDKGGIPLFVKLLSSSNFQIAQQAVWVIGNIAGDCSQYRDMIINAGGIQPLIKLIENCHLNHIVKQGAWALSNLCRGNPLPKYEFVKCAIPTLAKVIKSDIDDLDIITDCTWAISYMSDGAKSKIQKIVQTGVVQKLVMFLTTNDLGLLIPSLRTLGNIATGNQEQTQQILKYGALAHFEKLLYHNKKLIRRETCWTISNIAAGVVSQVERIIYNKNLVSRLKILLEDDAVDVKKQICWIFSNISHTGNPVKVFSFYQQYNIMQPYLKLLRIQQLEIKAIEVGLQGIKNMLQIGQKINPKENFMLKRLYQLGGVQVLEKLQYHDSLEIYTKVNKILTDFFQLQEPLN